MLLITSYRHPQNHFNKGLCWFQKYEAPLTCCRAGHHQSSGGRASGGTCHSCCLCLNWCPTTRSCWSRKSWTFLQKYPILTWFLKLTTSDKKLPNSQKSLCNKIKSAILALWLTAWQRKPNALSLQCILIPATPVTDSGASSLGPHKPQLVLAYMWTNWSVELCLPVSLEW